MAAFEPTANHKEFDHATQRSAALIADTQALRLPRAGRQFAISRGHLLAAAYQRKQPQMDSASMARFVRSLYTRRLLTAEELGQYLPDHPAAGLFQLCQLGAARLGVQTRLTSPVDVEGLVTRLKGTPGLEREDIVILADAGHRLGMFDAPMLGAALQGMDVPLMQFPAFWCDRLLSTCTPEMQGVWEGMNLEVEFHSHDLGAAVELNGVGALVHVVTVPGGNSSEAVLLRDTLLALVEGLLFATEGLSPSDCIMGDMSLYDDAHQLRDLMGGAFTGEALIARLQQDAAASAGEVHDNEGGGSHAMSDLLEDFYSLSLFDDLNGWAKAMSLLSDPGHWLTRGVQNMIPAGLSYNESLREIHRYCDGMVTALREQYGSHYPATLDAAARILGEIAVRCERPLAYRHPADQEALMDGNPLGMALKTWLRVKGGDDADVTNALFDTVLASSEYDYQSSGGEYGECFFLTRSEPDSAVALREFVDNLGVASLCLMALSRATEEEVEVL